ncbi:class I SAM-dependent methyltransferase [Deinococcus cellulosilyticus]|uniref:Antibiotic biosynthesis protein n=1 Tax=Deinococcus cellulosilyticus (strain DSM 18568 / NBRC 106333 / KACC 11606 / 5516J-15) TaxID=1223518 RepID=A0A511MWQ5_DEIC1|nr:class I SAM-dependent methyltransferase [Deinococcus cellulosilyticus]GEM45015.1 antibiotic biosynthesis protein [Deinococcus cellulosilyticus NBRC 106333 = KACC 11606]
MDYTPLADLYQQQYAGYYDDIHHYARMADRIHGKVLELGAGGGRVTIPLARRGHAVTALELSSGMLDYARFYAQQEGVEVQWVQGDMRDFDLSDTFDLIIAPFNALMHLYTPKDQKKALDSIVKHLAPGGTLAFDVYVPNFGLQGVLRHEGETFITPEFRRDVFVMQRIDPVKQLATTQYFVDTTDQAGTLRREHHSLIQRYYTRYELEWMLLSVGLQAQFSGSFSGDPFTAESHVMVVQASRI